jgi:hypothetical protein
MGKATGHARWQDGSVSILQICQLSSAVVAGEHELLRFNVFFGKEHHEKHTSQSVTKFIIAPALWNCAADERQSRIMPVGGPIRTIIGGGRGVIVAAPESIEGG